MDTEEEAVSLIAGCCVRAGDGEYYARELVDPKTGQPLEDDERIKAFVKFGQRLEKAHKRMKQHGKTKND